VEVLSACRGTGLGAGICLVLASGVIPALILGTGGGSISLEPRLVVPLTSDAATLVRLLDDEGVALLWVFPPPKKPEILPLAGVITCIGRDWPVASAKGSRFRKSWFTLDIILLTGRNADRFDDGDEGEPWFLSSRENIIKSCWLVQLE